MDRKGEDVATRNQRIRKQELRGDLQNQVLGVEVQKAEGHKEVQQELWTGQVRSHGSPSAASVPEFLISSSWAQLPSRPCSGQMWVSWGLSGISAAHLSEAATVLPLGHLGVPMGPLGPTPGYSAMDMFKPNHSDRN